MVTWTGYNYMVRYTWNIHIYQTYIYRLIYIFCGMSEFKPVTKEICKLPSFFSTALFRKIDVGCTGIVTRYVILYMGLSFYLESPFLLILCIIMILNSFISNLVNTTIRLGILLHHWISIQLNSMNLCCNYLGSTA